MTQLRTVLFDLDGTLIDSIELILESYHHTLAAHGREPVSDAEWLAGVGTPLRVQLRRAARSEEDLVALAATYREYNLANHDRMIRPFPGVTELVLALRDAGYLALVALVDSGIAVDDFQRGLVDYSAGQYDVALVALEKYIKGNPVNNGSAHYYRALTFRALQRTPEAVKELEYFIKNFIDNPNWLEAWNQKAFLQWSVLGDYPGAAQTLLDYVTLAPGASNAPEFLINAGLLYERDNQLELAAQTWERVANEYPSSEQTSRALFWAGIARYGLGAVDGAIALGTGTWARSTIATRAISSGTITSAATTCGIPT